MNYEKKDDKNIICNNCQYGFGLVKNKCQKCKVNKCAICNGNIDECEAC